MSSVLVKKHPDYWLLFTAMFLAVWGFFTLSLVSFPLSLRQFGNPWYYLCHQGLALLIGLAGGFIAYKLPLARLRKWAFYIFLLNLFLAVLVFFPGIGLNIKGSHRWLNCGLFVIQPSEFLKLSFAVYLAAWLACHLEKENQKKQLKRLFAPFLLILLGIGALLIKQPDMSTLGVITGLALTVYFLAKTPVWHSLFLLGGGSILGFLLTRMAPYRFSRLSVFLNPDVGVLDESYHLKQSLIAVGSGKIFGIGQGLGWGLSRQKFGFLPDSMADSIFAIIGEELGFAGAIALILLFLIFCWRGLRICRRQSNSFQGLLAAGITFWLGFQAFFNIGGIIGVWPLGGVPLPFFSYGGSHIIAELAGVGLLLNISRHST